MEQLKKYFVPANYVRKARSIWWRHRLGSAIVVAGLGRCGTTYLYDSLIRSYGLGDGDFVVDLSRQEEYRVGHVYKTHDYPPKRLPAHVKVIYMFRNPMNIAISAHQKINQWGRIHHQHFHSDRFRTNDDILREDTLMLDAQFDAWYRPQGFEFMTLKYENMFDPEVVAQLADYLELPLEFPDASPSRTDYRAHPFREALEQAYGRLAARIEEAEPCRLWKPVS